MKDFKKDAWKVVSVLTKGVILMSIQRLLNVMGVKIKFCAYSVRQITNTLKRLKSHNLIISLYYIIKNITLDYKTEESVEFCSSLAILLKFV